MKTKISLLEPPLFPVKNVIGSVQNPNDPVNACVLLCDHDTSWLFSSDKP